MPPASDGANSADGEDPLKQYFLDLPPEPVTKIGELVDDVCSVLMNMLHPCDRSALARTCVEQRKARLLHIEKREAAGGKEAEHAIVERLGPKMSTAFKAKKWEGVGWPPPPAALVLDVQRCREDVDTAMSSTVLLHLKKTVSQHVLDIWWQVAVRQATELFELHIKTVKVGVGNRGNSISTLKSICNRLSKLILATRRTYDLHEIPEVVFRDNGDSSIPEDILLRGPDLLAEIANMASRPTKPSYTKYRTPIMDEPDVIKKRVADEHERRNKNREKNREWDREFEAKRIWEYDGGKERAAEEKEREVRKAQHETWLRGGPDLSGVTVTLSSRRQRLW